MTSAGSSIDAGAIFVCLFPNTRHVVVIIYKRDIKSIGPYYHMAKETLIVSGLQPQMPLQGLSRRRSIDLLNCGDKNNYDDVFAPVMVRKYMNSITNRITLFEFLE